MLNEPLPSTLDVRKAAVRDTGVSGVLRPLDLQRFRPLLAADEGLIKAELSFSRDEEKHYLVTVDVIADIQIICQRCLEAMSEQIQSSNTLAAVWTDEEAAQLPRHLDALIVGDESCKLWELVEDELMLAMRPFSYHDTEDCKNRTKVFSDPVLEVEPGEEKPNPFNVLAQLKPTSEQ